MEMTTILPRSALWLVREIAMRVEALCGLLAEAGLDAVTRTWPR
jgi:hypothetical protein